MGFGVEAEWHGYAMDKKGWGLVLRRSGMDTPWIRRDGIMGLRRNGMDAPWIRSIEKGKESKGKMERNKRKSKERKDGSQRLQEESELEGRRE
jgi:hypothetical protein